MQCCIIFSNKIDALGRFCEIIRREVTLSVENYQKAENPTNLRFITKNSLYCVLAFCFLFDRSCLANCILVVIVGQLLFAVHLHIIPDLTVAKILRTKHKVFDAVRF